MNEVKKSRSSVRLLDRLTPSTWQVSDHRSASMSGEMLPGSVGEYLLHWLAGKQSLRPSTRQSYTGHVRLYLIPHLGHLRLKNLAPCHIEAMYRDIASANGSRVRPVGASTLRRIHATLMSALGTAARRGLIPCNPAETVELTRTPRHTVSVWSAQDYRRFMCTITDDPLYPLYLLLGVCGLRRGEAVGLRWSDVDLDTGCLHIRQQLVAVDGASVVGEPKSRSGHRVVALDDATARLLHWHGCAQRLARRTTARPRDETDLVFTSDDAEALDPTYVSRHFDRLITKAGLPRIRLHDLRHTSASMGLESGESLLEVSRRLGHSSITITADIYAHLSPVIARESAERLSQHIFGN